MANLNENFTICGKPLKKYVLNLISELSEEVVLDSSKEKLAEVRKWVKIMGNDNTKWKTSYQQAAEREALCALELRDEKSRSDRIFYTYVQEQKNEIEKLQFQMELNIKKSDRIINTLVQEHQNEIKKLKSKIDVIENNHRVEIEKIEKFRQKFESADVTARYLDEKCFSLEGEVSHLQMVIRQMEDRVRHRHTPAAEQHNYDEMIGNSEIAINHTNLSDRNSSSENFVPNTLSCNKYSSRNSR